MLPATLAYLGPSGTYSEAAAIAHQTWRSEAGLELAELRAYPSITRALQAVAAAEVAGAIVPVENSIQGSVTMTLDALWEHDGLAVQQALVLPIAHVLLSHAQDLAAVSQVYSHPQALAQCQHWLEAHLPQAQVIPTHSTTEALEHLPDNPAIAAISSQHAAQLYGLPVLAREISDRAENYTRFWAIARASLTTGGNYTALAFATANQPGALLEPLRAFADRKINLCRLESRPTRRSLGEYVFFVDLEVNGNEARAKEAIADLQACTETLKYFGSYEALFLPPPSAAEPSQADAQVL